MDFYGRNDITLGGFLERYCFHMSYSCPSSSCQSPITAHVRRFVHDAASIVIIIRQLANPVNVNQSLPGSTAKTVDDRTILMWSWCRKCKQVSIFVQFHIYPTNQSKKSRIETRFSWLIIFFCSGVSHSDDVT